jgi:NAD(P)H-flavin reductase
MMLYAFGAGEIPISMSGDPARRDALVHTIRAVGAVSRAICEAKPGAAIGVRGPYGSAWPLDELAGRDLVLVAGGVGLAPLRPVVHAVMADRGRYGRVSLLIGARTPDLLLFPREYERWRKRGIDVHATVDAARPGWAGSVGPVTVLIPRARFDPAGAAALLVGPEVMVGFVVRALGHGGIPRERLFVSMERNMQCAVGFCGHCQLGPAFVCKDGPVFPYARLERWLSVRNI